MDINIDKIVENGKTIKFWLDRWFLNVSFAHEFPTLYSIASHPNILVTIVFEDKVIHLHFDDILDGNYLREWQILNSMLTHFCPLDNVQDSIRFRWTPSGHFTVHAMYHWLQYGGIINNDYLPIWKSKISLKIKIFLWLVRRNRILSKTNLKNRGWIGSTQCAFCSDEESTDHLFVTCHFINSIWQWIARHNNFTFTGTGLADLWYLDSNIPLKDVIETVRGAVLWVIWFERNEICFNNTKCRNIKSIGLQIISLVSFWYTNTGTGNLVKLSLVLPQTTYDLLNQVPIQALEVTSGVEAMVDTPLVEDQVLVLALPTMCGSIPECWWFENCFL
jgi:zinc-binding in reverse transcriptase